MIQMTNKTKVVLLKHKQMTTWKLQNCVIISAKTAIHVNSVGVEKTWSKEQI